MLQPKKTKFRKTHLAKVKNKTKGGSNISFGEYGLKAIEKGFIDSRQIEAARVALTRFLKRGGRVWITIFPDQVITSKPAETRMGSGKGLPEKWAARVSSGRIIFEIAGIKEEVAREAFRLAAHKLSLKTKFVVREEV